jgi:hypothetical protein
VKGSARNAGRQTRLLPPAGVVVSFACFAACAWADQPSRPAAPTASALSLTRQGNMITGRLTGTQGRPVA